MAEINVEEIVDYLSNEFGRALVNTVKNVCENVNINQDELYKEFQGAIYNEIQKWERVPDKCIRTK